MKKGAGLSLPADLDARGKIRREGKLEMSYWSAESYLFLVVEKPLTKKLIFFLRKYTTNLQRRRRKAIKITNIF